MSHRPPQNIVAETQLEFSTDDRQAVDVLLSQLIDRVAKIFAQRQQGDSIAMPATLRSERAGTRCDWTVSSEHSAKHLRELTQLRFERIKLPAPVTAVKLSVLTAARLKHGNKNCLMHRSATATGKRIAGATGSAMVWVANEC